MYDFLPDVNFSFDWWFALAACIRLKETICYDHLYRAQLLLTYKVYQKKRNLWI